MDRRLFLSSALSTAAVTRASHPPLGIAFLGGSHSHAGAKVRLTLKSPEWNVIGMWEDDPKVRQPDISIAGEILGWEPEVDLPEGIRRTIPFLKAQLES